MISTNQRPKDCFWLVALMTLGPDDFLQGGCPHTVGLFGSAPSLYPEDQKVPPTLSSPYLICEDACHSGYLAAPSFTLLSFTQCWYRLWHSQLLPVIVPCALPYVSVYKKNVCPLVSFSVAVWNIILLLYWRISVVSRSTISHQHLGVLRNYL